MMLLRAITWLGLFLSLASTSPIQQDDPVPVSEIPESEVSGSEVPQPDLEEEPPKGGNAAGNDTSAPGTPQWEKNQGNVFEGDIKLTTEQKNEIDALINKNKEGPKQAPGTPQWEKNQGNVFEGDIKLTKEQKNEIDALIKEGKEGPRNGSVSVQKRKHLKGTSLWPGGILYYEPLSMESSCKDKVKCTDLSKSYCEEKNEYYPYMSDKCRKYCGICYPTANKPVYKDAIFAAMRHIESQTCVKFKERKSGPRARFVYGNGCNSAIGMLISPLWNNGVQKISIGENCASMPIVIHEIMHALGFMHEQSRPDRDNYIDINPQNVQKARLAWFEKYNWEETDTLRTPYDLRSIMHYSTSAFSKSPGLLTIVPKDRTMTYIMGQSEGLSKYDVLAVNRLYKCPGTDDGTTGQGSCQDKVDCTDYPKRYCNREQEYYPFMGDKCRKHCGFCYTPTET